MKFQVHPHFCRGPANRISKYTTDFPRPNNHDFTVQCFSKIKLNHTSKRRNEYERPSLAIRAQSTINWLEQTAPLPGAKTLTAVIRLNSSPDLARHYFCKKKYKICKFNFYKLSCLQQLQINNV